MYITILPILTRLIYMHTFPPKKLQNFNNKPVRDLVLKAIVEDP